MDATCIAAETVRTWLDSPVTKEEEGEQSEETAANGEPDIPAVETSSESVESSDTAPETSPPELNSSVVLLSLDFADVDRPSHLLCIFC
jgi:hypothetical protein